MLNSNAFCDVRKNQGFSLYGEPLPPGAPVRERCAIVRAKKSLQMNERRADSTRTNGRGDEFVSENRILLDAATTAGFGDMVIVAGIQIKVMSLRPQYDVLGRIDHYEMEGELWA